MLSKHAHCRVACSGRSLCLRRCLPLQVRPFSYVMCSVWLLQEAKRDFHACIANNLFLGASKSCLIMQ